MDNAQSVKVRERAETATVGPRRPRSALVRWAPLALVAVTLVLFYALGLHEYLSLAELRRSQDRLVGFVEANWVLAAAAYLAVYTAVVAVSIPGAGILTIAGGFMFGAALGTALAAVAGTIGATLIFLIARTSLGEVFAERAGPRAQRLRQGFQEEGFSYLLFLRLVPVFPFWLVNLAAALFGMRLATYVTATAIGIVPATFVFSYFGQGLGTALDGEGAIVPGELLVALGLLGVLSLAPAMVRRWRRGKEKVRALSRPGA